ncbi:MAG: AAA family ATPase [Candidatus Pristimantibacillus sp.]
MATTHFQHAILHEFPQQLLEIINSITFFETSVTQMTSMYLPNFRDFSYEVYDTQENGDVILLNDTKGFLSFYDGICSEEGRLIGKYGRLMEYLSILFEDVQRISKLQGGTPSRDIFITWKKNGHERTQPLSRSGSGVASVLYIVGKLLMSFSRPSIGIIDEPENGIHPKLQIRLMNLLKRLSRDFGVQWLIASHSTFIIQRLKVHDKLNLLEHNGLNVTLREVDVVFKEEVFRSLGAYLPFTLTANGVIFTEGPTETEVLTILLRKIGLDPDKEGILIFP